MPRSRPDLAELNRRRSTHGHTRNGRSSPTFLSWKSMMQRSHFGTCKEAPIYLGQGITVCERWLSFENFLADMGERPTGTTLDRIENAKGYAPGNCRWATPKEQARNRRTSRLLTAFGRTQHLDDWARELGTSHQTIHNRIRVGWTIEEALSVPVAPRSRRTNP